jgi:hypothetical protein
LWLKIPQHYIEQVLERIPADILVFILTDPSLIELFPDLNSLKPVFEKHYAKFTRQRIKFQEEMRMKGGIFYLEDLKLLPQRYYPIYNDTETDLKSLDWITS